MPLIISIWEIRNSRPVVSNVAMTAALECECNTAPASVQHNYTDITWIKTQNRDLLELSLTARQHKHIILVAIVGVFIKKDLKLWSRYGYCIKLGFEQQFFSVGNTDPQNFEILTTGTWCTNTIWNRGRLAFSKQQIWKKYKQTNKMRVGIIAI